MGCLKANVWVVRIFLLICILNLWIIYTRVLGFMNDSYDFK